MLTLRTTFSVYSRFYVIQGSSVRQTLFKKETASHGIDRYKLPTKRCTLRQIGKVMTQWCINACNIKDWNLNSRLITLFEIKLEDIEDILIIIKLKKNTITNVNYLLNWWKGIYISIPSSTLWYNFWFKSYEYEGWSKITWTFAVKLTFIIASP